MSSFNAPKCHFGESVAEILHIAQFCKRAGAEARRHVRLFRLKLLNDPAESQACMDLYLDLYFYTHIYIIYNI